MGFITEKINKYLNKKKEISNKERLLIALRFAALTGVSLYLGKQVFNARVDTAKLTINCHTLYTILQNRGIDVEQIIKENQDKFIDLN